jgi:SecD/SecF fusion protein
VFDDQLISAPSIQSTISSRGEVTGKFTQAEVEELVSLLRAGRLPATLKEQPLSEDKIDSQLGRDMRSKGIYSIGVALLVVLVFMVVYYRFAGLIACFALISNIVMIVAMVILVKQPFTLTGLAGLVLTVGMSVDANVLIFERIREELARGAALRMAIRNGFGRATTTIVDANLTTLITAIVLYTIGTDQIRGFSVTLILGILMSMFTAIFCSRVIFDIAERRRWITKLSMMKLIGTSKIDFIGKRRIAAAISVVLILVGLIAVFTRKQGILAIDLAGGQSVRIVLNEPMDVEEVRGKLTKQFEELRSKVGKRIDFTVNEVDRTEDGLERDTVFKIDASIPTSGSDSDPEKKKDSGVELKNVVIDIFGDKLARYSIDFKLIENPIASNTNVQGSGTDDVQISGIDWARHDLPPATVLALADDGAIRDDSVVDDSTPSLSAPADSKTDESSGGEGKDAAVTDADKPGTSTGQSEKPAEKPNEASATGQTPTEDPSETAPSKRPDTTDPKAGASQETLAFELTLEHKVTDETLRDWITEASKEFKVPAFDPTNPESIKIEEADKDGPGFHKTLTLAGLSVADATAILSSVKTVQEKEPYFRGSSSVGSQIAGDTQTRAIAAMFASLICIIIYIWIRFQKVEFGLAAVVALVHDVLVVLGAIAVSAYLAAALGFLGIEEFKISLPIIAAFLTIIGYSLNDTIVVFDRIREVRGKSPELTGDMINRSIGQTLSRTLLTSLTTLLVVVILYGWGGEAIHGFAFALVVGVLVGTYSSIFVASPVLLWMMGRRQSKENAA